jgi:lipopolysaccharide export system ATP-binding protein
MLGPNGVGKSTIFNLITGLISPQNGKLKLRVMMQLSNPIYLEVENLKWDMSSIWRLF